MKLEFLIPGDLQTATGGYGYDRRIIAGLRTLGWVVVAHTLDASFPFPTAAALAHADSVLVRIANDSVVLIDGLALGAMPQLAERHAARLRLVALVHHPLAAESGLRSELARQLKESETRALAAVDAVIVTSSPTRDALRQYGVMPEKVAVVEPGTDPRPLARRRHGSSIHDSGREVSHVRMLCVATLTPRKGYDVLFDALAPFAALSWHLMCVGSLTRSPQTSAQLQAQLQSLGLGERVTLAGEANDEALAGYFEDADLFVMPARYEGYGMAVAEALAYGLPIVATCTGAIPLLVGTKAGLLVAPGDSGKLSAALSRILLEPQLLAELTKEAALVRATLPRWPAACAALGKILERIASGGTLQDALERDRV